jgi:hypothetical protein
MAGVGAPWPAMGSSPEREGRRNGKGEKDRGVAAGRRKGGRGGMGAIKERRRRWFQSACYVQEERRGREGKREKRKKKKGKGKKEKEKKWKFFKPGNFRREK